MEGTFLFDDEFLSVLDVDTRTNGFHIFHLLSADVIDTIVGGMGLGTNGMNASYLAFGKHSLHVNTIAFGIEFERLRGGESLLFAANSLTNGLAIQPQTPFSSGQFSQCGTGCCCRHIENDEYLAVARLTSECQDITVCRIQCHPIYAYIIAQGWNSMFQGCQGTRRFGVPPHW